MNSIIETIGHYSGVSQDIIFNILKTVVVIAVIWALRRLLLGVSDRFTVTGERNYNYRKTTSRVIWIVGLILIVSIWLEGITSLATYLGLVSAGIAIALKDPLTDIAGWFFITWRAPFELTHRIEVGAHKGDVIDIRIFKFTILEIGGWAGGDQPTGRIVHVPNSVVFSESIANYTDGFNYIWDELNIHLTYESDWRKAKTILNAIVVKQTSKASESAAKEIQKTTRKFLIRISQTRPMVVTSVDRSGILLSVRYLVPPTKRRFFSELIWEEILGEFEKHNNIEFAYSTVRVFNRFNDDGKRSEERPNF
ncbi:MAG: mechanosensitive ion channel [Salinivirgaceae bacterium]|nr:mechanosensitive ion channel [Salinivirgaceae bacterium]